MPFYRIVNKYIIFALLQYQTFSDTIHFLLVSLQQYSQQTTITPTVSDILLWWCIAAETTAASILQVQIKMTSNVTVRLEPFRKTILYLFCCTWYLLVKHKSSPFSSSAPVPNFTISDLNNDSNWGFKFHLSHITWNYLTDILLQKFMLTCRLQIYLSNYFENIYINIIHPFLVTALHVYFTYA